MTIETDAVPQPAALTVEETPPSAAQESVDTEHMLIKRIVKNTDGGVDATISLTAGQAHFLLNFAMTLLLAQGAAVFVDVPEQEGSEVIDQGDLVLGERIQTDESSST